MKRLALAAILALLAAKKHSTPAVEPAAPVTAASPGSKPSGIVGESDPCTLVRVVDGDTVDVKIGDHQDRLRLLDIDTEESHKSVAKPVTPYGLETSAWAKTFIEAGGACWVEYGPERRDVYDRLLAILWIRKDNAWLNYNLHTVEIGRAPYFTKYGYSKNHHEQFAKAQTDAQEKKLGIWDPMNEGNLRGEYMGKDGLIAWWNARAEELAAFEKEGRSRPDVLDTRMHFDMIKDKAGSKLTVFTSIRTPDEKAGFVGKCEGKLYQSFEIVAAGGDAAAETALKASVGHYRYFTGTTTLLDDKKTLRLSVASASDISATPPAKAPPLNPHK